MKDAIVVIESDEKAMTLLGSVLDKIKGGREGANKMTTLKAQWPGVFQLTEPRAAQATNNEAIGKIDNVTYMVPNPVTQAGGGAVFPSSLSGSQGADSATKPVKSQSKISPKKDTIKAKGGSENGTTSPAPTLGSTSESSSQSSNLTSRQSKPSSTQGQESSVSSHSRSDDTLSGSQDVRKGSAGGSSSPASGSRAITSGQTVAKLLTQPLQQQMNTAVRLLREQMDAYIGLMLSAIVLRACSQPQNESLRITKNPYIAGIRRVSRLFGQALESGSKQQLGGLKEAIVVKGEVFPQARKQQTSSAEGKLVLRDVPQGQQDLGGSIEGRMSNEFILQIEPKRGSAIVIIPEYILLAHVYVWLAARKNPTTELSAEKGKGIVQFGESKMITLLKPQDMQVGNFAKALSGVTIEVIQTAQAIMKTSNMSPGQALFLTLPIQISQDDNPLRPVLRLGTMSSSQLQASQSIAIL